MGHGGIQLYPQGQEAEAGDLQSLLASGLIKRASPLLSERDPASKIKWSAVEEDILAHLWLLRVCIMPLVYMCTLLFTHLTWVSNCTDVRWVFLNWTKMLVFNYN